MMRGPGAWVRKRPRAIDSAVAALVFLYTLPMVRAAVPPPVPTIAGVLLAAVLCGSYLLCRRRPLAGFGAVVAVVGVQLVLGIGFLPADIMILLALYRVALERSRSTSVAVAVVAGITVVVATLRWDNPYFATSEAVSTILLVVSVWIWGSMVGIRRAYVAALEDRAAQLARDQENQNRIIVAEERSRIAREIHDIVSHGLSVVVVMAQGAAAKVHTDPDRAQQAMRTVESSGRTALADMRSMLHVLRDDEPGSQAPPPRIEQLGLLVDDARTAGSPVELTCRGTDRALPAGVDLAVYRIVQEALTNARKHAGPDLTRIDVGLTVDDSGVEVRIRDDGVGPPSGRRHGGHGVIGMRERVAACGGELQVGQAPGGGFEIIATLPIGECA
ncbi:sensor histidine kinase [Pseudonocardia nantongensis]